MSDTVKIDRYPGCDIQNGSRVKFRKKGDCEWRYGITQFQWLALDEPCIEVRSGFCLYSILPGLGDEIEVES